MTYMQTIMEHEDIGYNKGRMDGFAHGVTQAARDCAIRMIKNKEPFEKVADYTNLTIEQIGELAASVSVVH